MNHLLLMTSATKKKILRMKLTNVFRALAGIIVVACSTACLAKTILETTTAISQSDPIQMGRISRNGIAQDWSGSEAFGVPIYQDFLFHFHTYTIPSATLTQGRFIQIELDDQGLNQGNLFVAAYANSINPGVFDTNWLGDAGQSGNFLGGTDPVSFQVVVPPSSDLVILVWNAGFYNLGVGEQFRLIAEQFSDVAYREPGATPTPTPTPTATPTPTPTATPTSINLNASLPAVKPGKSCTLTFTATPAAVSTTTVNYATSGTAVVGKDYTLSGGTNQVTFLPGRTSATVIFTATKHHNAKKKIATITITKGTDYTIGPNTSASVTIPAH